MRKLRNKMFFVLVGMLFFFVFLHYFGRSSSMATQSAILTKKTALAANAMLDKTLGGAEVLNSESKDMIAKRLNALVYNFCQSPGVEGLRANNSNMDALFVHCVAACGGRSYVLKILLAIYGIHSRYENLYNLPIQGNHVVVQANINGWTIMLDPTFGLFFTKSGKINALPMSLQQIRYYLKEKNIYKHVFQARKQQRIASIKSDSLDKLYSRHYSSSHHMQLSSYINSETYGTLDQKRLLILNANLYAKNGLINLGCLHSKTVQLASDCLLKQTNNLYNKQDNYKRYISYDINYIGYMQDKQPIENIFSLHGLKPDKFYAIQLLLNNSGRVLRTINIESMNGLNLMPGSEVVHIKPGLHNYLLDFRARNKVGTLVIYPVLSHKKWSANLFAIAITSGGII